MNTLSWMIYLGDVVGSLNGFIIISIVFLVFVSFIIMMGSIGSFDANENEQGHYFLRKLFILVPTIFFLGFLTVFIPSKRTFYLIAASEMTGKAAETVMADPEVKEIFELSKKRVLDFLREDAQPKKDEHGDQH